MFLQEDCVSRRSVSLGWVCFQEKWAHSAALSAHTAVVTWSHSPQSDTPLLSHCKGLQDKEGYKKEVQCQVCTSVQYPVTRWWTVRWCCPPSPGSWWRSASSATSSWWPSLTWEWPGGWADCHWLNFLFLLCQAFYFYLNALFFILVFLLLHFPTHPETVQLALFTNLVGIIYDIVALVVFFPAFDGKGSLQERNTTWIYTFWIIYSGRKLLRNAILTKQSKDSNIFYQAGSYSALSPLLPTWSWGSSPALSFIGLLWEKLAPELYLHCTAQNWKNCTLKGLGVGGNPSTVPSLLYIFQGVVEPGRHWRGHSHTGLSRSVWQWNN